MRKEGVWKVFGLFRIALVVSLIVATEALDLNTYYAERLIVTNGHNGSGTELAISAQSKEEAIAYFSAFTSNCTFLDPNDVREKTCEQVDDYYCEYNNNVRETNESSNWKSYSFMRDDCECNVDTCEEAGLNGTETVLYPGCLCDKSQKQCDFNKICHDWTTESTNDNLTFNMYLTKNNNIFNSFIQAGHPELVFHRQRASMISSVFRQSGFDCTLRFMHHFTPQTSSSKLVVRAHLLNGEKKTLYEFTKEFEKAFWKPVAVQIGSFSQPFYISIDCETGSAPRRRKFKQRDPYACSLANLQFDNCQDVRNPLARCARGGEHMCSTPSNTKCLQDSLCDLKMDCEDGSDEAECGSMARGSMCDFNNPPEFCEGWFQITRISEYQESQFEPTTLAPLNKFDDTPIYLLRIRAPNPRSITREARKGSGMMLVYESVEARKLSRRTSILVSPPFPRTNPEAYDPKSSSFQTCKLRFYVCARTYLTTWHISIISKANNPFDSGKTVLYDPREYELTHGIQTSVCEWRRVKVNIPRQNGGYRLGIFVEHQFDREDFFGIDDLSFSPTCFEKDVNQSSWETPDLLISTCGISGFERPANCDKYRALDGQTGLFVKEDGIQEWTAPITGFYRIEACGASGGSAGSVLGDKGECLTLQVHLLENIALRMLIGQMGESGCLVESTDDAHEQEIRPASCAKNSQGQREGRETGAGGGGATLITVEADLWNVVVGGGAGASWEDGDAEAGYGASVTPVKIDPSCKHVCRSVSHTDFMVEKNENQCPDQKENQTTVLGGFGGGGNSCGLLGGSGAGYQAGNPFGTGRERSGSSNVTGNFSNQVIYYQAENVDEGFIKISFCRKQCDAPFVCKFGNDKFDEEYCGCPDGNNKSETCECPLDCPSASSCQYRNFTYEPFCMCNNGKYIEDFSKEACEESQGWAWYNYLFFLFFLSVTVVAIIVVFHYRSRTEQMKQEIFDLTQIKSNEYMYDDIYFGRQTRDKALERLPPLVRADVEVGRVLGKGNFGEVLYGTIAGQSVAVKTISKPFSTSSSAQADFCNEALCMGTFVHENIVRLIGINFDEVPYFIVIEFMEGGDLLSFVKDSRPNQVSLNPFHLTMADLVGLSRDVGAGCRCLEDYGYVHRDIAARNILLTTRGEKRVAKIADFGMAKEITYGSEYYRLHGRAMLPIKWTPPEAFIDGVFTTKSDIWSFGILCWEVFSLGVVPYPNRRNEEVMLMLTEGARLEYPYGIPTRVYQLMRDCWRTMPAERPTFVEVVDTLEDILTDPSSIGMPFPIHPTVRASYAHAQSTPVSVETPMTAITDISMNSTFTEASTAKMSTQQDVQDRIQLHELMLTRERPYTSDMAACVIDNLRKDLAKAQFETGKAMAPQPEYLSPESIDESMQLILNGNVLTDQTPPTSLVDLNRLAVQNTGPTLHRPDSLNFHDDYSSVPLLACQTR